RPGAARARSWAGRRSRGAACTAAGSRRGGPESAPKYGLGSSVMRSEAVGKGSRNGGDGEKVGAFIRVARARANRYLLPARGRCERRILGLSSGRSGRI